MGVKTGGSGGGEVAQFLIHKDDGLTQCVWVGRDSKKRLDSGYIWKLELIGFVHRLDVEYEIKRGVKNNNARTYGFLTHEWCICKFM